MIKKFATEMHGSRLYSPITSAELSILWSSFPLFLSPFHLFIFPFCRLYTNLRYGYTRDVAAGFWMKPIIWSLWPTLWSSGIPKIDPRSGYLPKVGIRVSLRLFNILGYIFQSDRFLVFRIPNCRSSLFMLSIIRVFLYLWVFWLILGVILSM